MTTRQRVWAWAGVVAGALVAIGLLVLVLVADLDTAGQVAGIVGTLVGMAALGVSTYALAATSRSPGRGPRVTAGGARSVAVGGTISGAVSTGDGPRPMSDPAVPRPPSTPPGTPAAGAVSAPGERSVAAGGDISGSVSTGDGGSPGHP
ncbi:hypothetical protein [Streptomyces sp. NPDC007172]|uniref:hypothetical protein n=1 Tax=Streptomyces sp. NPDC007172 TaxID=3364776 RepID=UPI00369AFC46